METNTNTNTNTDTNANYRPRWGLCEGSLDAIEWALGVNAENGEEVGFRLVEDAGGTRLEADSPHDALDAADYIEREADLAADMEDTDTAELDDMRDDMRRIRRVAQFWRGGADA